MTKQELEREASRRITALKRAKINSPAAQLLLDVFGRRTRTVKIKNEREYLAAKAFVGAATSTPAGARRVEKEKAANFKQQLLNFLPRVPGFTDEQKQRVMDVFNAMTPAQMSQFADTYGDIFATATDSKQQFITVNGRALDRVLRYKITTSASRVAKYLLAPTNIAKEEKALKRAQALKGSFAHEEADVILGKIRG